MPPRVLVVYGGNPKLAREVQRKLYAKKFDAQVGGEDRPWESKTFFLGQKVLDQLDWAEQVVVLAQWTFEGSDVDTSSTVQYSPKLLFELGYVVGRLRSHRVHLFLIGIKREDLPADLIGTRCKKVPLTGFTADLIAEQAEQVVQAVAEQQLQIPIDPIAPLLNWERWKHRLNEHLVGRSDIDDGEMCGMLLHSIQPAYYFEDRPALRGIVERFAEHLQKGHPHSDITYSIRIVQGALDYYALSIDRPSTSDLAGEYRQVTSRLRMPTEAVANDRLWSRWAEAIRRDFLGLCHRRLADLSTGNDTGERQRELQRSAAVFQEALEGLSLVSETERRTAWKLWHGYLYRNLARTYFDLGESELGREAMSRGGRYMRAATDDLQAYPLSRTIGQQLACEEALRDLDPAVHSETPQSTAEGALDSAAEMIIDAQPRKEHVVLWQKLFVSVLAAATRLHRQDIVDKLNEVHPSFEKW